MSNFEYRSFDIFYSNKNEFNGLLFELGRKWRKFY